MHPSQASGFCARSRMDRRDFLKGSAGFLASLLGRGTLKRFHYAQIHMGMRVGILSYAPDEATARKASKAAFDRISELEDIFSDYRPGSELSRLSLSSGGPPVKVSKELFAVLRRAQELSSSTDGAFDVTVGPYTRLWRRARITGKLPSKEELEEARSRVGWRKMILDPESGTVQLTVKGMWLDLGGIAKGYILDEALKRMRDFGVGSALIEAGGDIALGDPPPGREGWLIRCDFAESGKEFVLLHNSAISSSGDTEQFIELGGVRFSHIIDPKTGLGLTNRIIATVIASDCMNSDALATAICVLGEEKGVELARIEGVRAYIRRVDEAAISMHRFSVSERRDKSRTFTISEDVWAR